MSAISRLIWLPEPPAVAHVGDVFVEAPPPEKLPNDDCGICYAPLYEEPPNNQRVVKHRPELAHHFHKQCIELWLSRNPTCPTCRDRIHIPAPARVNFLQPPAPTLATRAIRRITWELKHFSIKAVGAPVLLALTGAATAAAIGLPIFVVLGTIDFFSPSIPSLVSRFAATGALALGVTSSAILGVGLSMTIVHIITRIGYFCLIENRRLTPLARMVVTFALAVFSAFVLFKIASLIIPAASMRYLSTHLLPHELADGLAASQYIPRVIHNLPFSAKVRDVALVVSICRKMFIQMVAGFTVMEWYQNSSRLTLEDDRRLL